MLVLHNFPVSNSKCGNQIHCCNPNNKVVYYIRNIVHNNKSQCLLAPISCVNVTTWNVQFVQFERLILIWGQLKWRIQREFDFRTWLSLCLMRIKLLYSIGSMVSGLKFQNSVTIFWNCANEAANIETEGGGVRLPPSFLKNDGNASIWIKKLLYL